MDGDAEGRALCAELFADPSHTLPRMLAQKDIATVFAVANKMRNDWSGHGDVVSQDDARAAAHMNVCFALIVLIFATNHNATQFEARYFDLGLLQSRTYVSDSTLGSPVDEFPKDG
jgi:hypothetical protein